DGETNPSCDPCQRRLREFGMKGKLAAAKGVRIEIAEHDARVGYGGLGSAEAVAGRSWVRARALRANPKRTGLIDPGEAAAASADRRHVDHLLAERILVELAIRRHEWPPPCDQSDVATRSANIYGDDILSSGTLA